MNVIAPDNSTVYTAMLLSCLSGGAVVAMVFRWFSVALVNRRGFDD